MAVLLRINLEPATPEEKKLHQHLQTLLDAAVVQQAENSVSRRRGSRVQAPERSVHRVSPRTSEQRDHAESGHSPVKHRLGPNCNALDMVSAGARAMMAANAKRAGSTTGGMESATIAARTGRARRPTQGIRGPSLRTCSPSFPRLTIRPEPRLSSTTARPTRACGSRTTARLPQQKGEGRPFHHKGIPLYLADSAET